MSESIVFTILRGHYNVIYVMRKYLNFAFDEVVPERQL